jgi:hypothetical protein
MAIYAIRSAETYSDNISLLAEFQVSIERAASVLDSIATLNYEQQEDAENWEKFARNAA